LRDSSPGNSPSVATVACLPTVHKHHLVGGSREVIYRLHPSIPPWKRVNPRPCPCIFMSDPQCAFWGALGWVWSSRHGFPVARPLCSSSLSHRSMADALAVGKAAAEACTPKTQRDQDTWVSSCPVQACSPLQGNSRRCVGRPLDNSPSLFRASGKESKQGRFPKTNYEIRHQSIEENKTERICYPTT
jgi:hypothetical protein